MDENKNSEMSVEELLEKLRDSLQDDKIESKKTTDTEFDDITAAVKAAIKEDETSSAEVNNEVNNDEADDGVESEQNEELSAYANEEEPFEDDVRVAPDVDIMNAVEEERNETYSGEPSDAESTVEFAVSSKMNVNDVLTAIGEDIESSNLEEATEDDGVEILSEVSAPDTAGEEIKGSFSEADIFAAWGIESADAYKNGDEPKEQVAENEYVAPSASNTKIYKIVRVEHKDVYTLRKASESQKETVDYDKTDCSLIKQALGMEKPTEDSDTSGFAVFDEESKSSPKTIDSPHEEFTYQRQRENISHEYKSNTFRSKIKLILAAVFTVALFLIECLGDLGFKLPVFLDIASYPVACTMISLQLVWLCGALSYKEFANGVLSMFKMRFTAGSILALLITSVTVCDVISVTMGLGMRGYHFAAAFCALIVRAYDYFDVRREMISFEIASSEHTKKYVALEVPNDKAGSIIGLEDYMGDDALVLRTEKCSFVENYFSRTAKGNESDVSANKYLVPLVLAVAVASLIITIAKGANAASVVRAFSMTVSVGLPIIALLSASYPLFKASKRLYRKESAIIGEGAVDEYSGTTMICFDDADAFPSYGVALENLRIYGKGDIETIIEQMGAVFSKLGGPLKNVFALMTADCPRPYSVKINGVYENGINAVVDGRELFIGNAYYMEESGFKVVDKSDELRGKRFSTMYLAEDGALRAKFFIRYTLDGSFETIVKKLAKRGIASVILTGDSNINDELLSRSLDISRLPVKVVRRRDFDTTVVGDRADSGVVSKGAIGDLVSAVTMCDRLAGVIGTMRAVRIASAVICALLALGAVALQLHGVVSSLHVMVYHLFWLVPAWLISKFNL